jgi:inhibitor of KinA sporulation pathway (predicted exonuclease)
MRVGGQATPWSLYSQERDPVRIVQGAGWTDSSMKENFQQYIAPLEFPPLTHRQHLKLLTTIQLHRVHKIFV